MVTALERAKALPERAKKHHSWPSAKAAHYAFDYDDETISELERTIAQASAVSLHAQTLTGTILKKREAGFIHVEWLARNSAP